MGCAYLISKTIYYSQYLFSFPLSCLLFFQLYIQSLNEYSIFLIISLEKTFICGLNWPAGINFLSPESHIQSGHWTHLVSVTVIQASTIDIKRLSKLHRFPNTILGSRYSQIIRQFHSLRGIITHHWRCVVDSIILRARDNKLIMVWP